VSEGRIRNAERGDLPAIVAIYNAAIPGRMATADTAAVTVEQREEWFRAFDPARRPLWVLEQGTEHAGWLGLRSFYGRPAYHRTVEIAVYVSPERQRKGHARRLLAHALAECPRLGVANILAFVFAHNTPSVELFERFGFADWGRLPRVCELDGVERDVSILGLRVQTPEAGNTETTEGHGERLRVIDHE
jgi:phosphinothricin acetyltransferase